MKVPVISVILKTVRLSIFFDESGDGIDFGNGEYKSIVVNHASESSWLGPIDEANFAFYIDLDPDFLIMKETWDTDLASILEGHEPIARVRIQGYRELGYQEAYCRRNVERGDRKTSVVYGL